MWSVLARGATTALVALGVLALSGCGPSAGEAADGPVVAAAFYPLAYVAERVTGGRGAVENLTSPGGEPHDLTLTVRETAAVAEADLVVLLEGFQPAVDDAAATVAEGRVLDAGSVVALRPKDPHFWLDPLLMADLGDAVADELADVDPGDAARYAAGADHLRTDLTRLDAAYDAGLADCARHTVVVSHDAFGYLERYGIRTEPIAGLSPGAEPTPADLARLHELVSVEGVTTVFSERLTSPEAAQALAADTGIRSALLDPIEGLTDDTAGQDYLSLMRANLAALRRANGC